MKKKMYSILFLSIMISVTACSSADNLQLEVTEVTVEYGDALSLDPKEYLVEDTSEDILNDTKAEVFVVEDDVKADEPLDTDGTDLEVGNYILSLSYNEEVEDVNVTVSDTTAPEFVDFNDTISIEQGTEGVTLENLFKAEDASNIEIIVTGDVDYNTVGTYPIKVIAKDEYDNVTEKDCNIVITEKKAETPSTSGGSSNKGSSSSSGSSSKGSNSSTSSNSGSNSSSNSGSGSSGGSTATQTPSNPSQYLTDRAQQAFNLINQERANAGLPQLTWANDLTDLANIRAKELVEEYLNGTVHSGLNKYDPTYSIGEIANANGLGWGYDTAERAVRTWMESSGHRNAILADYHSTMAVSCYYDGEKECTYWIVLFK